MSKRVRAAVAVIALGYLIPLGLYVGMVRPIERMANGGLGAGAMLAMVFAVGLAATVGLPLVGAAIAALEWRAELRLRSTAALVVLFGVVAAAFPLAVLYAYRAA